MNPTAWAKANPEKAIGGGGAVAVALYAFLHARKTKAAAGSTAATDPATGSAVAGLSGLPNTTATDLGNQLQDQLNTFETAVQTQLNGVTAPTSTPAPAPAHPVTLPKASPKPSGAKAITMPVKKRPATAHAPAGGLFTIPKGGTLFGAAQHVYKTTTPTPAQIGQLASKNGIKLYQRNGVTMADVHPGQRIKY